MNKLGAMACALGLATAPGCQVEDPSQIPDTSTIERYTEKMEGAPQGSVTGACAAMVVIQIKECLKDETASPAECTSPENAKELEKECLDRD